MQKHAKMPISIVNGYPKEESNNDVITQIHAHVHLYYVHNGWVGGWVDWSGKSLKIELIKKIFSLKIYNL